MKINIFNKLGEQLKDTVSLEKSVFSIEPNEHCVYLAVKSEMASFHQGTHSSKDRSQVSGSGRKPWKQKGTGRSRVGSINNPSRVHGGVTFGPQPHSYHLKVNKKVKTLARKSVLSDKLSNGNLTIVEDLNFETPKTKDFTSMLSGLKMSGKKVTVLASKVTENLWLSARNIKNISVVTAEHASTYDLLDCQVLLADKSGIEKLNTQLAG